MHALLLAALLFGPDADLLIDAPTGDPGEAKAVITDQYGNPPPLSVPFGRLLVFSAESSTHGLLKRSIKWSVSPKELDARKWQPMPTAFAVSGEALDEAYTPYELRVRLSVALGDTTDDTEITIKVGGGPRPPPDPEPKPDPKPEPKPDPQPTPTARHLSVFLAFADPKMPTVNEAIIRNSQGYWATFDSAGHKHRFFAKDTPEAGLEKEAILAKTVNGSCVLVYDRDNGKLLEPPKPLPQSITELDDYFKKFMVK